MLTFSKLGKMGRFGNMLFQIAGTIGIAERLGLAYAFPPFINYEQESEDMQQYFVKKLPQIDHNNFAEVVRSGYQIPWGYHEINVPKYHEHCDISGYLQSEKYFKHCEGLIREQFQLKVPDKLPLQIPDNAVCMHIRRGDYIGKQDFHPLMPKSYYQGALTHLWGKGIYTNSQIYIFSDDHNWAKEKFSHILNSTVIEGNHYMTDFYLMTQCTHFIIANSSFSWWAAWLSNKPGKTVVAPKNWFGPAAGLSAEDIYCKDWIVI